MDAATVHRLLALIPDRLVRAQSGTLFTAEEAAQARDAERVEYMARFLNWLSPLNPITREDQRALGLLTAQARPGHAMEEADDADEADEILDEVEEAPLGMELAIASEPTDAQAVSNT